MSLKKIADVKRKRRFSTGDGVYEGDGYAGSDVGMGYQGGTYGGGDGYGGESVSGPAASHVADVGESVSGTAASHAGTDTAYNGPGTISNTAGYAQRQGVGGLSADGFTRNALGHFADRAMPTGGLGLMASMAAKALDRFTGAGYSHPDFGPGGKYEGMGGETTAGYGNEDNRGNGPDTQPFGAGTPAQTTPAPAAGSTGMRQYVWDPQARQYRIANLGAQDNPMGYEQGQVFQMAAGGRAPSGISAGMPRFVQGGGTGLSDDVPVTMDDGGEGRLADGEFVIPADVVSGLGGGSSAAGSKMLFDMMERIRQQAHGKSQQIRPVDPQQVLPA